VHGYWSLGGGKMSKSVGNVVEALALSEKYGNDAFRYFVMREMTFGLDASFSEEAFGARLNADLANDLGNLVSRATTLIAGFGGGVLPAAGTLTSAEEAVGAAFARTRSAVDAAMEEFAFQRALAAIWEFLAVVNRYVDTTAPWQLLKGRRAGEAEADAGARRRRGETVLHTLGEALRGLGILLVPFLPDAAAKIRHAVGVTDEPRLADAEWGRLAPGTTVAKVSGLFPRIEARSDGARAATAAPAASSAGRITIADFARVDLRVAEVLAAEAVPRSKKLLRLTISLGDEQRTLVAGIAESYAPADLVGKCVIVVANLEPATLMGIESHGMILAGATEGKLAVVTPDRELPPGAKVT
jgi:methionyl-tRNA synthetase